MLTIIAIVSALVVCSFGQTPANPDPTKVCFPDNLQFTVFNLNTDEAGVEAIDFKKNILGYTSPTKKLVQDFTALKTYITDANGHCQVYDIRPDGIFPQCLPSTAVFVGEANWGFGPNALPEDGYQLPYNGGIIRILITKQPGQPRYIMLSKYIEAKGNYTLTMYLNPSTTITQANVFDIPRTCTPASEL